MRPTKFPQANEHHCAPPGVPADDILPLHVARTTCGHGMWTRWEPTDEERAAIAAGEPVWLYVSGTGGHPVVCLTTDPPFVSPSLGTTP